MTNLDHRTAADSIDADSIDAQAGDAVSTAAEALAARRAERRDQVTSRRGPAAFLAGEFVTDPDQRIDGAPGRWSPLPDGGAGLLVRADASEGVRIGGVLVDGEAVLYADAGSGPTIAEFPDGAEGVIFSYDRTKFALQVWRSDSDWAKRFHDIAAYPRDTDWIVTASVRPVAAGRTVAITHHRDPNPVAVPVVAELTFTHDGAEHHLLATPGPAGEDQLLVHFRDATNGDESYASGRSVRVQNTGAATVDLDFNQAELLPCSFSHAWNCPLPPAENTLPIPVRAGERNAVDAAGVPIL
ncbi:DUF1684 domain-containing protein [Plantibacter sp. Mn2098]|uniref:DUF1684 domain-containing protein n=1 Tax=Plantibacter sp. Mn2098 TaxID=3395266 RepID=UPI003BD9E2ED